MSEERAPRKGEELDADRLRAFFEAKEIARGEVSVLQFPGGHSNLTYAIRAGDREFVLRRPPFGNRVKTAHDMSREFRILSKLCDAYPPAPRPLIYCDDESVIGAPFYVMTRIRGTILRRAIPAGFDASPDRMRKISLVVLDGLVDLHAIDFEKIGLGDFGKPDGYVERQVTGWAKRYEDSKTDDIPEVPEVARWLAHHIPKSPRATILHNDWKHDNLVLDDDAQLVGVLDWEMSTIGDPLMDLGTAISYWVEAGDSDEMKALAFGPTMQDGCLSPRELASRYAEKTGRSVDGLPFYYAFALFKTAVVAQQIYSRFKRGVTSDERFAMFVVAVRVLSQRARDVTRGAPI